MKQADKVIRKGDYYEMQVVDDGLSSMKPYKKEETSPHLPPPPENLMTNLPLFSQARANYYFEPVSTYSNAEPDQLLHELQEILIKQKLSDSDKQEILKLIKEIRLLKEQPLVPLIELTPIAKIKEKQPSPVAQIDLKVKISLGELEDKVAQLQKFGYPQLNAYEHQLEVLLGEKKTSSLSQLPKDDRNKQEIEQLFSQCSSLTCATDIAGLVSRVYSNSSKYQEMLNWTQLLENTMGFHFDFLTELNDDEQLLNRLEANFQKNVNGIKQAIETIKKEANK